MTFNSKLSSAVEDFAALMLPLSEKDLEQKWTWKDHDEEGVRFAFFVTLQELRHLAVTLAALRPKPTAAQYILSQYHSAYMDLQAALLGLPAEEAGREPVTGEWSVQRTYAHILTTELTFTITVRSALEKHRARDWTPERVSDADANRLADISDFEHESLIRGSLKNMLTYHRQFHRQVVDEFSAITDDELILPSTFWEETRFPIHHRLHRYEAHLVQHTVQIDKTLAALGQSAGESKRLLRKIYAALAEAEGMTIGMNRMTDTTTVAAALSISERTKELEGLLKRS
ncbi:MAG TPA: DinB family protein [Anaerolineales bacterium]|nr:DinB family protein [Anaerolineales bacterium]